MSIFDVQIDGATFTPSQQTASNKYWGNALSNAHRQSTSFCLCTRSTRPPLIVKLYGAESKSQHYGLARWPGTGLDHNTECQYFGEEQDDADSKESKPAFDDLPDGKVRAHLATALKIVERNIQQIESRKGQEKSTGTTRARASEVSLLLKLWRTAGLNVYKGSPRKWFNTSYSLLKALPKIIVTKEGETLSDYLLIGSGQADKLTEEHNSAVLARAKEKFTRLFVIGRLKEPRRDKPQILLPLQDFHHLPKTLVNVAQIDALVSKRDHLKNMLQDKSGNVIVIACIEPSGNDWWKTISIAAIGVTQNMIPVESSYEVEFEAYLTGLGRTFLKPLVINETGDGDNRPDFILLDTNPRVRCEVWGMQTDIYLSDKEKRIADYAAKGHQLISWSANPREDFPNLPPSNRN